MNEMIRDYSLYKVKFPSTIRLDDFILEEKDMKDLQENVDMHLMILTNLTEQKSHLQVMENCM